MLQLPAAFTNVLDALENLEAALHALNAEGEAVQQLFLGLDFPEQAALAEKLEEKLHVVTHEEASTIGFQRADITTLALFILFRKHYALFNDEELTAIIDAPALSADIKKHLCSVIGTPQEMLSLVATLRHDWNSTFANTSYTKVKHRLAI